MRTVIAILIAALVGAPLSAQEKAADKPAPVEVRKEMTEDGKKLFEDMERVYKKYYDIVLEATKLDKTYDADQTWDTAVKETKNAAYKDRKEFFEAVQKMQKADKVFKEKSTDLINDSAAAYQKAVDVWIEDLEKKK